VSEPLERWGRDRGGLVAQARALLAGQRDLVANAANLSALLFHSLYDVNELLVGPFQGKPACVTIPLGRGVCGTAAASGRIQRVADVQAFDGHIACDSDSRSEIVVPLVFSGEVRGVLDLDSPVPDRFDQRDEDMLREIAAVFVDAVDWA
jgi:GAF domain-containing protein